MVFHVISSKLIILVLFYYISVFEFFVFTYYVFVSTIWICFFRGGTFCQSLIVTSYLSLVTSHYLLVTSYQSLVINEKLLVTSCQSLVARRQSTGNQLLVRSHQLLVFGLNNSKSERNYYISKTLKYYFDIKR